LLKTVEDQPAINEVYRERIQRLEMMVSMFLPEDHEMHTPPWPANIVPVEQTIRPKTAEERGL
jgi:hypothetical protein